MLLLETGMLGVFLAQDLFLFYIFWEFTLVPMYFLIGIWGGGNGGSTRRSSSSCTPSPARSYAAGDHRAVCALRRSQQLQLAGHGRGAAQNGAFVLDPDAAALDCSLAFFAAFAIKVPLWPFHTWLPDAHTEAPTAGSVILAGVLLKLGGYGLIRFNLQLFPEASRYFAPAIGVLAVIGIIYGALDRLCPDRHQEAGRLLVGQPPGLCGAGHLRAAIRTASRRDPADGQPRPLDRRAVLAGRHDLRAPPHPRYRRFRRPVEGDAGLRLPVTGDRHVVDRACRR